MRIRMTKGEMKMKSNIRKYIVFLFAAATLALTACGGPGASYQPPTSTDAVLSPNATVAPETQIPPPAESSTEKPPEGDVYNADVLKYAVEKIIAANDINAAIQWFDPTEYSGYLGIVSTKDGEVARIEYWPNERKAKICLYYYAGENTVWASDERDQLGLALLQCLGLQKSDAEDIYINQLKLPEFDAPDKKTDGRQNYSGYGVTIEWIVLPGIGIEMNIQLPEESVPKNADI